MKGILNQEVLLICLRYLRYTNGEPRVYETFFDSTHIKGQPTGQNVWKSILEIFENIGINVAECRAQAYGGVKVMTSEISGAAAFINKQQPLKEYIQCRSHYVNLAISFACKNKSIQKFIDNVTHRRGSNTWNYSLISMTKSYSYMKLKKRHDWLV